MKNLRILHQSVLDRYSVEKSRMIAIVGNAGIGPDDEEMINAADCVVRFNNYATRENVVKTLDPFKCDILFSTFDLHSNGCKPNDVVIGIPYPFKAKEINLKPQRWYPNANHWMVNPYLNMEMCAEMSINSLGHAHPLPSIGFTALWHMRNWPGQFYVCGFNWYNTGHGQFQNHDIRNTNYPSNWNHNYNKEVRWILANLASKNNFIFSSECARILMTAKQVLSNRL